VTETKGNFEITAATGAELDITNYSGIYDAAAHSISVDNLIAGDTVEYSTDSGITWSTTNPEYTNVGVYTVEVKVTNPNYESREGQGTVTITVRTLEITAASDSKVYDGLPLTNNTATALTLLAGHEMVEIEVVGTQIEVGSSSNVASGAYIQDEAGNDVTANYDITYVEGTLTVTQVNDLSLKISKTPDRTTFSSTGEVITYTYVVENTGNVSLFGPFTIVDDKIGSIDLSELELEVLEPGEPFTVTATYTVTSADLSAGKVTNIATATGNFIDETQELIPVTNTATATVTRKTSGGGGNNGGGGTVTIDEEIPEALPELNKEDHFQYIQGYPDNTVRPEGRVTREEVTAVFYRLLANNYRDSIKTLAQGFGDVNTVRWSNKHIATLANGKIVEGYPDGSFKPENFITRAELATISSRFDNLSPFESNSFSDITGHWANKYINSSAQKGWVNGYPDGSFKPDQYITRAEFVTLVNNVLERRVRKENILENARMFPDLVEGKWYYEAMQEAINSHFYTRLEDSFELWEEIYYPQLDM
jgi:hypothetical protein